MTTRSQLLIQEQLRTGITPESVAAQYALVVKRHTAYPNLLLFKYNQLESPMDNPLVQQCRGLILDADDNWHVVSRPFDKFFNHGEGYAAPIDWTSARVQEKLDGSLCSLYSYMGEWHVATSGTPDALGVVNGFNFTFADLFWRVFWERGYEFPTDQHVTYMFELMTPYNRVVVRHEENDLKLIGLRDNITGQEYSPATTSQFEPVREFPLQTIEDIESTFRDMDPIKQEGYVIVDGKFNRVKVKHPGYVAIHHMRDGYGPRRILEVIRSGETTELLNYFPEWREAFNQVQAKYDTLVGELENMYDSIKDIDNQKDFALQATKLKCSGVLFGLRKGQIKGVKEGLANMHIKYLVELLNIADIELGGG